MAWQTPKTDWQAADVVSKDDFNRIEGNIQELQNTKETPAGAQAKANATLNSAQQYTDQALTSHSNVSASTSAKGHIEIATQAEVNAGTDTTRAVPPAYLKVYVNSFTNGFKLWVGTQAEYDAIGTKDSNTLYFVK